MLKMVQNERIVIEHNGETGVRLKHYSQAADAEYWTGLWRNHDGQRAYRRAERGHLPHQLRGSFLRWTPRGGRVLEAGCGLGHFTVAARALGFRAVGLDWSEPTVALLRSRFPQIPWHTGDVRRLHFQDDEFDAVYSPGVCEHFVEGPAAILAETARVLRRGGIAFVSTPCFNTWLQRHVELFAGEAPQNLEFYQYWFSPDGLSNVLRRVGFRVLQVRPYATLANMTLHGGWKVPAAVATPLAVMMDYTPGIRNWGSTCLWVASKR